MHMVSDRGENGGAKLWMFNYQQRRYGMRHEKIKNLILMVLTIILVLGVNIKALRAEGEFDKFIKPVTNPVYFDEPFNRTYVELLTAYQHLPSQVNTTLGGDVPLDGHLQLTALRINYAVNDRLSIVAAKDGYIDFAPKYVLTHQSGWGDIAGGLKYAFILDPKNEFVLSGKVLFEFSQGSRAVFQGNGSGNAAPSLSFLKGWKNFEFVGMLGGIIPFNGAEESSMLNDSWHISYDLMSGLCLPEAKNKIFPLVELNHFRVLSSGHRDEFVASVVKFEGGDVINLGAKNSDDHPDFVTLGVGFRYRSNYHWLPLDFGFAYEFPLTQKENGLMSNRLTWDLMYRF
jgi:hypothetical protein